MKKIITSGNQLFNVPNTDEGRLFLKQLSKFKNKRKNEFFKCRGRGKRGSRFQRDVPVGNSEWVAVYMYNDSQADFYHKRLGENYAQISKLAEENLALKKQVALLEKMNDEANKDNYNLDKEVHNLLKDLNEDTSNDVPQETTSITITIPKDIIVKVIQQ